MRHLRNQSKWYRFTHSPFMRKINKLGPPFAISLSCTILMLGCVVIDYWARGGR